MDEDSPVWPAVLVCVIPVVFVAYMVWRQSWARCRWKIRRLPEVRERLLQKR